MLLSGGSRRSDRSDRQVLTTFGRKKADGPGIEKRQNGFEAASARIKELANGAFGQVARGLDAKSLQHYFQERRDFQEKWPPEKLYLEIPSGKSRLKG